MSQMKLDVTGHNSTNTQPHLRTVNTNGHSTTVAPNVRQLAANVNETILTAPKSRQSVRITKPGLSRVYSETHGTEPTVWNCSFKRSKQTTDSFVQHQADDFKPGSKTNTLPFLHPDGERKGRIHSSFLDDKGFSRSLHLSTIYGTMLILFGIAFPVTEALRGIWMTSHIIGVFMTYLFSVSIIYVVYFEIYEVILIRRVNAAQNMNNSRGSSRSLSLDLPEVDGLREVSDDVQIIRERNGHRETGFGNQCCEDDGGDFPVDTETENGTEIRQTLSRSASTATIFTMDSQIPDDVYDYITTHRGTASIASEETNYFLNIGLLAFAVANMVYIALRIEGEHQRNSCRDVARIIYPHYVHLAFIIVQTFFLTKMCKYSLRKYKALANFGLMHLVATNLCVWFRYLVTEVLEALYATSEENSDGHASFISFSSLAESNVTNKCSTEPIMEKAGHYLFPFILEYSLIAMTILFSVYGNINIRVSGELYRSICDALQKQRVAHAKGQSAGGDTNISTVSRVRVASALEKSHRGLSLGAFVLAGVVVSIVLFFFWKQTDNVTKAQLCHDISELSLLALFVISNGLALWHLFRFMFNPNSFNGLDHALLLISANFYIVLELFITFSKVVYIAENESDLNSIAETVSSTTSIVHTVLQVLLIADGMQRVSVDERQLDEKKGRGVITFLVVLNAAMWIFESFQDKFSEQTEEIEMYGDVAWAIISSLCHPLQLFFYFHSAICLAHMWHNCYKEPEYNVITNTGIH